MPAYENRNYEIIPSPHRTGYYVKNKITGITEMEEASLMNCILVADKWDSFLTKHREAANVVDLNAGR